MTLIDTTERQTSEDVVVQGGGWIFKGLLPPHLKRSC